MKRLTAIFLALALCLTLAACGGNADSGSSDNSGGSANSAGNNTGDNSTGGQQTDSVTPPADEGGIAPTQIGSLKGPTSIGLAHLRSEEEASEAPAYEFTLEADASALLAKFVNKELDIALIPANAAAIWYNKLEGDVVCLDVNTLGVLYIVGASDSAGLSVEDLAGKTIYLPGQGTSPDYVLQYLLAQHNMSLDDVMVEYKSEAAEVIASLAANPEALGVLPQPSVTAALAKLEGYHVLMDLTEEWGKVCDTGLITGVTVIRREFLENVALPGEIDKFLESHAESADFANQDAAAAAALTEQYGIMDSAAVAEKAIPSCNVTCVTGQEMKDMVSAYLQVLYDLDPASVGGQLPADDFYYLG